MRAWLGIALIGLVGCVVGDDWTAQVVAVEQDVDAPDAEPDLDRLPPPGVPVLDADTFMPGTNATLWVVDADPNVDVKFFLSTAGQGNGPCNAGGTICLGILSPRDMGTVRADGTGYAELVLAIPATVPVGAGYDLQAVMLGPNAAVTNVVHDQIVAAPPPVLSHAVDIQPIWNANCTICHGGPFPSGGMDLSGDAYPDIVGVPAGELPSMSRIEPFDPTNSYIWHKLSGTQAAVGGSGVRMPANGQYLQQPDMDVIEQWILGGALP